MDLRVFLDTNIFISIKNKEENANYCEIILDFINENKLEGIISPIVISEVLVAFYLNREYKEAEKLILYILQKFNIIDINTQISIDAAKLRAKSKLKLPDAIIIISAKNSDFLITDDTEIINNYEKAITSKNFVENQLKKI